MAHADATEALQWATENGQQGMLGYGLSMLARIEAARGEQELCQTRIDKAQREVEPRGVGCAPCMAIRSGWPHSARVSCTGPPIDSKRPGSLLRQGIGNPNVFPIAGDLAETLARIRGIRPPKTHPEVAGAAGPGDHWHTPTQPPAGRRESWQPNLGEAQRLFAASLAALDKVGPVPFEQARTLLCSGEAMRRDRRPVAARMPSTRPSRSSTVFSAAPGGSR